MKSRIDIGHQLLPCYICRQLKNEFWEQGPYIAVLHAGIATVQFPVCSKHARLSGDQLWAVLEGGSKKEDL